MPADQLLQIAPSRPRGPSPRKPNSQPKWSARVGLPTMPMTRTVDSKHRKRPCIYTILTKIFFVPTCNLMHVDIIPRVKHPRNHNRLFVLFFELAQGRDLKLTDKYANVTACCSNVSHSSQPSTNRQSSSLCSHIYIVTTCCTSFPHSSQHPCPFSAWFVPLTLQERRCVALTSLFSTHSLTIWDPRLVLYSQVLTSYCVITSFPSL